MAYRIKCLIAIFVLSISVYISPNYITSQWLYIRNMSKARADMQMLTAYFDLGVELFLVMVFVIVILILAVQVFKPYRSD